MDAMFFIVLGATLASFLLTLLFGRFVIPMLRALHAGQSIREVGPQWHNTKAGTPTMGGLMFIAAIILCTVGFGWKSMTENHTYTHLYVLALALCYGHEPYRHRACPPSAMGLSALPTTLSRSSSSAISV